MERWDCGKVEWWNGRTESTTHQPQELLSSFSKQCVEVLKMIAEFSIVPLGKGVSLSKYVARVLDIVDKSGVSYKVNPMGTVVEGNYDKVMSLIRECHFAMLEQADRVVTSIKIDHRKGVENAIEKKIPSVEEKLGRTLKK